MKYEILPYLSRGEVVHTFYSSQVLTASRGLNWGGEEIWVKLAFSLLAPFHCCRYCLQGAEGEVGVNPEIHTLPSFLGRSKNGIIRPY